MRILLAAVSCCLVFMALAGCEIMAKGKLEGAVLKALEADSRTSQYDYEVSVQDDGSVLITGEIANEADKAVITEVAKSVPGVERVQNNCAVPEAPSDMMQDSVVNTPYL